VRHKKILSIILASLLFSTLFTGCWDKMEIDKQLFISVIAVDLGKDYSNKKEAKEMKLSDPFQGRVQQKKLSITYGFPDMSELGPGKSGTAKDQFINVDAASMEDGIFEATGKSSRSIYLSQTKLLMISSGILEDPDIFKEIIDYIERHPNLNKMMQIVVVEGSAEEYVKYQPPMEKNVEYYLTGLMENTKKNSTILPVTVSEMLIQLGQNGNAIIPKLEIEKEKNEITLSGVAIIKNYGLKGYLTRLEVADLEIMRGNAKGGKRVIYKEGHPIDVNIEDIDRKLRVSGDKNKLKFNIDIKIEGQLKGYYIDNNVFSKEELNSIEKNFSDSLSKECNTIAKMLQNNFQVDPIGLREYLEERKPSLWNEVKDNWDEVYKDADINVNINFKIRRIGISK